MNMPRFTGEASLYQTSGHYRTGRQIIYSSLRPVSSFYPAVTRGEVPIDVPGETIPVHSCAPGWIDIGGMCWPAPLTEPSPGGGSAAPGGGSAGSGPGGGVGGGGTPFGDKPKPIKTPRKLKNSPLTGAPFNPVNGEPCHVIEYSWRVGDYLLTDEYFIGKGEYRPLSGGVWLCGPGPYGNDARCGETVDLGEGAKKRRDCYNGHSS